MCKDFILIDFLLQDSAAAWGNLLLRLSRIGAPAAFTNRITRDRHCSFAHGTVRNLDSAFNVNRDVRQRPRGSTGTPRPDRVVEILFGFSNRAAFLAHISSKHIDPFSIRRDFNKSFVAAPF